MDPRKIVNNMLGTPKVTIPKKLNMTTKQYINKYGPKGDIDGDGFPNFKDCRPFDKNRDMVHYGYYKAMKEDGSYELVYAGSIAGVRKIGEDQTPPVKYVDIEELTYKQALALKGEEGLTNARLRTKGYTSAGKRIIDRRLL